MKTSAFPLTVVVFYACLQTFAGDSISAAPVRGQGPLLSLEDYPIETWRVRSQTNFPWFVAKEKGWYVDWDCERARLAYLVVHHTAGPENETPENISETVRKRIYEPVYQNRNYTTPYVYGLPAHSGHIINGKETFTAYHYLIYSDGRVLGTLVPYRKSANTVTVDMIAWGAGNWRINCQSVQVALVGNWSKDSPPTPKALEALKKLIVFYRALVPDIKIVGHYEVRPKPTECPGNWWPGWIKTIR